MSSRFIAAVLMGIALNGWCAGVPQTGACIFIEIMPPFTSQDSAAKSTAVYLDEKGFVQRYVCEDAKVNDLREGSLSVADIFKTLSAFSLISLPARQGADPNQPPSQAHPGHARIMLRQSGGAQYLWEGDADNIPSGLKKLVKDSSALAEMLPAKQPVAGAFIRADVLSADRLDDYRFSKLLKTIKSLSDLDPLLQDALAKPFCMIPVPEGKNPFSAFVAKGESSPLPLLLNGAGYAVNRYPVALATLAPAP